MEKVKSQNRDFIRVGRSRIDGLGVFAKRKIPRGTRIIEYTGEHVPVTALYHVIEEGAPSHIYGFALDDGTAIDGARNGNDARFFNHSCRPNCEPYNFDGHVYIYAMREILRGEELTFDYKLGPVHSGAPAADAGTQYPCTCGTTACRGTLLAPSEIHSHEVPGATP